MTNEDFYQLQEALFKDILNITETKGKEYGAPDDRLANFKDPEIDLPPRVVCGVYMKKHLRAIYTYIREGELHSTETLHSRIVDAMTYLTLLYAIATEETSRLEEPSNGLAEAKGV